MGRTGEAIVGSDVADQAMLRPATVVPDIDTFIEFLAQIEALMGPIEREPHPASGEHFRL